MANRCPRIGERIIPLCYRCSGCVLGFLIAAFLAFGKVAISLVPCVLLIAAMGLDVGLQDLGRIPSTNFRRALTGILAGIGLGSFFWEGFSCALGVFESNRIILFMGS